MIREEFLDTSTKFNLMASKLMRDYSSCVMVKISAINVSQMLRVVKLTASLENLLLRAIKLSDGFVKCLGQNSYLTACTLPSEVRQNLLGASLDTRLSQDLRFITRKGGQPKVGTRGDLFDAQVILSADVGVAAMQLSSELLDIISKQNEGVAHGGYNETALEGMRLIASDFAAVATNFASGNNGEIISRLDLIKRLAADICQSLDISESKYITYYKNACMNCENSAELEFISRVSAAASAGLLKSIYPPLYFDCCYRYALINKLFDNQR